MTNSVCILVMAMKRNDGIQPKMIAMVATGVLPLSSDANEAMLKAAHKMTAKIMDRAGSVGLLLVAVARYVMSHLSDGARWLKKTHSGRPGIPGGPNMWRSVDANFHCGSVESLLAVVVIVAVGRDS